MPYVRDPAFKFSVVFAIHDGIWATSYAKHGYITPEFAKEGLRAALAYMSTFLPETIPLRAPSDEPPPDIAEPSAHAETPPPQPPRQVKRRAGPARRRAAR
jgi:hypothetical protein